MAVQTADGLGKGQSAAFSLQMTRLVTDDNAETTSSFVICYILPTWEWIMDNEIKVTISVTVLWPTTLCR